MVTYPAGMEDRAFLEAARADTDRMIEFCRILAERVGDSDPDLVAEFEAAVAEMEERRRRNP